MIQNSLIKCLFDQHFSEVKTYVLCTSRIQRLNYCHASCAATATKDLGFQEEEAHKVSPEIHGICLPICRQNDWKIPSFCQIYIDSFTIPAKKMGISISKHQWGLILMGMGRLSSCQQCWLQVAINRLAHIASLLTGDLGFFFFSLIFCFLSIFLYKPAVRYLKHISLLFS